MAKTAWGVKAKNDEQEQALRLLLDPSKELVLLQGPAGTGKTLLTLAAGLEQVVENRMYRDIIFTRAAVSVGSDMGFLPGEINDKMLPWAGALLDNLDTLNVDEVIVENKIKIMALQHMRGRSFSKRYVIIDETQNLTPSQVKVLLTRAGEDCKMIFLGDVSQIDNTKVGKIDGMTYLANALTNSAQRGEDVSFGGHKILVQCERSKLCAWATENL